MFFCSKIFSSALLYSWFQGNWCQSSSEFARLRLFAVFHRLSSIIFAFSLAKKFARIRQTSTDFAIFHRSDFIRKPISFDWHPQKKLAKLAKFHFYRRFCRFEVGQLGHSLHFVSFSPFCSKSSLFRVFELSCFRDWFSSLFPGSRSPGESRKHERTKARKMQPSMAAKQRTATDRAAPQADAGAIRIKLHSKMSKINCRRQVLVFKNPGEPQAVEWASARSRQQSAPARCPHEQYRPPQGNTGDIGFACFAIISFFPINK